MEAAKRELAEGAKRRQLELDEQMRAEAETKELEEARRKVEEPARRKAEAEARAKPRLSKLLQRRPLRKKLRVELLRKKRNALPLKRRLAKTKSVEPQKPMPRLVQTRNEKSVRRKSFGAKRSWKRSAKRTSVARNYTLRPIKRVAAAKSHSAAKASRRSPQRRALGARPLSARQRPSFVKLPYLKRLQLVNWPRECPLRHRPSSRR